MTMVCPPSQTNFPLQQILAREVERNHQNSGIISRQSSGSESRQFTNNKKNFLKKGHLFQQHDENFDPNSMMLVDEDLESKMMSGSQDRSQRTNNLSTGIAILKPVNDKLKQKLP